MLKNETEKSVNNRSRYLIKNFGILTISNFASKILVFLLVPLYTSVLTTTEYGTFDLVVSTVSLLFPIFTLNIVDSVMRFLMDKAKSKKDVASIGVKYIFISIFVISFLLLIMQEFNLISAFKGLEIYIFLYYISYVLNQFFVQYAKGLEKVKDMAIAAFLGTIVMVATNVLFLLVFKIGLYGFFLANILSQIIQVIYFVIKMKFWNIFSSFNIDKLLEKEMLSYSIPLIFTALGWWINNASDKYVVSFACGVAANGILSVAYKIPSIINTVQGIFNQAWQISAIKEYDQDDVENFYGNVFSYLNILMCVIASILILLTKPLASFLYAKDFYVAWEYVPFLLISCVFNFSSGFIGPILAAKKDSKTMAKSAIIGALTNLVLNILLVIFIGIQGVTIATAVSSIIIYHIRKTAVASNFHVSKYYKVVITWILLIVQAITGIYFSWWTVEAIILFVIVIINWNILKLALEKFAFGFLKN